MNKHERKFNSNDFTPRRFGLKYNPAQIVLEYLVPSNGKLYHHKIKLYKLKQDSNLQEVMKEIYDKHYMYLDNKKIRPTQIVSNLHIFNY
jgi:centrosomal protein CEP19